MNILDHFTLRTLAKNRVRTLITIIGIILSAAMLTAVTTSIASIQNFLVKVTIAREGDWHGAALQITETQRSTLDEMKRAGDIESYAYLQTIGYALHPEITSDYKPYIYIAGMSDNFAGQLPIHMLSGRLPASASEIILPEHLELFADVKHEIGDQLTLPVGKRMVNGSELTQFNSLMTGEDGPTEELVITGERSYTVVGIYARPSFEGFSAPGYTALTAADNAPDARYDAFIKLARPAKIYSFLKTHFPDNGSTTNSDLLRFIGASNERTFNGVLYGLAAVLIGLIMFGSISLIYNAFSISLTERTRQFGLLASIGSTRRQLQRSVLFEAFFLSLISIPLGILAGIAGIGLTFTLAEQLFDTFLLEISTGIDLTLHITWASLLTAGAVGLVTVLISAYIPAKRALRISPIDAVRQAQDITVEAKSVKTSPLTYRLFGLEGMLAYKNFKRNNKKYRATILSLFLSVVLFISASSFTLYLTGGVSDVVSAPDYDIQYTLDRSGAAGINPQALLKELSAVRGVTQASFAAIEYAESEIDREMINPEYLAYIYAEDELSQTLDLNIVLYFIEDELYAQYLAQQSLDPAVYLNAEIPAAVALDHVKYYEPYESRYYTFNILARGSFDLTIKRLKELDGYQFWSSEEAADGTTSYIYQNDSGEQVILSEAEAYYEVPVTVGTVADQRPLGVYPDHGSVVLLFPYSAMDAILVLDDTSPPPASTSFFFKADDHKAVYENMLEIVKAKGLDRYRLYNAAQRAESDRALISVVNIFSYGFITLISLIAAANVFNTISTNIALRRRELAMLRSIGMTQKGFNKMMNLECLLYGFKALVYGIPVAIGVTYLIYRSISIGLETSFFIPWDRVGIAAGSVFVVVFATMLYATHQLKKENVIDALRNENL